MMNKNLAEKTMVVAFASSGLLEQYLEVLKENLEPEEFEKYTKKTGKVMGEIYFEILNPIWKEYPELLPEQMGGSYKKNEKHVKQTHSFLMELINENNS